MFLTSCRAAGHRRLPNARRRTSENPPAGPASLRGAAARSRMERRPRNAKSSPPAVTGSRLVPEIAASARFPSDRPAQPGQPLGAVPGNDPPASKAAPAFSSFRGFLAWRSTDGNEKMAPSDASVRLRGDDYSLRSRFQSRRRGFSQMSLTGRARSFRTSSLPRPWVMPTFIQLAAR